MQNYIFFSNFTFRNFHTPLFMKPILSENYFLSAGESNAEQQMSLPLLISKLIDIATLHANKLGIGNPAMKELKAGWVLARLTVEMMEYPNVNEDYSISTWIENFNKYFSTRCFDIKNNEGKILGYARSVWMVMDTVNHTNVGLSHFHPAENMILGESVPIPPQAKHVATICEDDKDFDPKTCLKATHSPVDYKFTYCDLDAYRHVNTVRYVSLLLNQYSLKDHDEFFIKRIELAFLHEAKYGMDVSLYRADDPGSPVSTFSLINKENGNPLMFAKLFRQER